MESDNNNGDLNISFLEQEINANEYIIDNYLKLARNMKWMALGTTCLSLFLFLFGSVLSGIIGLFLAFMCVRKYNKSIGMAEVYFGVTKFLKFILQSEITGNTKVPSFLN